MPVSRIAKVILKKKPKRGAMKPITSDGFTLSEKKKKANELKRKANRIMGQAMKPEMRKDKRKEAESLRAQAAKLAKEAGFEEIKRGAGGVIKKGIKAVVKRGRKSKRGRPKSKVETKRDSFSGEVVTKKKRDPSKIKKLSSESDAAFKKRKASINKLKKEQQKEMAKERGTKEPSTKDRTSRSMTIPLKRKEQSKAAFRRRVEQGLQGVTKKGESKDIGKAGYPVSETMRELGYTGSRKAKVDLTDKELEALGFQIKKAGGLIDPPNPGAAALPRPVRNQMGFKKYGGKIKRLAVGGGVALRGLGVTRKK